MTAGDGDCRGYTRPVGSCWQEVGVELESCILALGQMGRLVAWTVVDGRKQAVVVDREAAAVAMSLGAWVDEWVA